VATAWKQYITETELLYNTKSHIIYQTASANDYY